VELLDVDRILSIDEAAALTPWSKTTLYREAPKEDSPFRKRGGRWVVVFSDLIAWVRSAPKPRRERAESPMPRPNGRRRSSFGAKVSKLERAA
jgi:predicted DNA-binding transcriptional regulator AlpA